MAKPGLSSLRLCDHRFQKHLCVTVAIDTEEFVTRITSLIADQALFIIIRLVFKFLTS